MSRRNVRGIMFAMEDMDTDGVVESNDVDISEVTEGAAELDDGAAVTEDTLATVEPLEEIAETMDEAAEGDGLSVEAAKIADIAIEALCGRLGFAEPKCIYSLESFGSKSSRQAATRIAAEEVWGKVKDTYNKIVAWIKEQIEKLIVFWKKMVTVGPMLKRNLESTKAAVDKLSDKAKAPDGIFEDGGIASALCYGDNKKDMATINALTAALEAAKSGIALADRYNVSFAPGVDPIDIPKWISSVFHKNTGVSFIGGKTLVVKEGSENVGSTILFQNENVNESATKCQVLQKKAMQDSLTTALTLIKDTEKFIKEEGKLRKAKDDAIKGLEKAMKDKDASDDTKKDNRKQIKDISTLFTNFQKVMSEFPTIAVKTAKVTNAYCQKSLSKYEKPEED